MKFVALIFVLTMDKQNAINFQLLGGIWILQTLPSVVFGLYTRWFHRWALLAGWAVAMVYGTVKAYNVELADGAALRRLAGHDGADRAAGLHRASRRSSSTSSWPSVAHADPAGAEVARG